MQATKKAAKPINIFTNENCDNVYHHDHLFSQYYNYDYLQYHSACLGSSTCNGYSFTCNGYSITHNRRLMGIYYEDKILYV